MNYDTQEGSTTKFILTISNPDGELPALSSAVTKEIIVQRPDKTDKTYRASFVTDGSDWKIYAIAPAADLDQDDVYFMQAKLTYSGDRVFYSEPESFNVGKNP